MSQFMNSNLPTCGYAHCSRPMLTTEVRQGRLINDTICWMCANEETEYLRRQSELHDQLDTELDRMVKWETVAEELGV